MRCVIFQIFVPIGLIRSLLACLVARIARTEAYFGTAEQRHRYREWQQHAGAAVGCVRADDEL